MNSGEACAFLQSTHQPVRVRWQNGHISSIEPASRPSAPDLWIAPSLMDLQVNGFAGVDFQKDGLVEADLLRAVSGLQAAGCSQFLLTLTTDRWECMLQRLTALRALRENSVPLRTAILGWHLEGPFLSSEPGFCGAHPPDLMIDPSVDHIRELREITHSDPVLLTLAPERKGALEAIELAAALGMKVSLGHTNASAGSLNQALVAGATGFTHFANACPQLLDRHDNILWRVLDTPGLTASLIPDGIHVSPPLFRAAHRALRQEFIYYTTDAVAPAGAPPGRYTVGRHEVNAGPDGIVRQPGGTNYAGSALRPADGIFRAARMLGRPWQSVWGFGSIQPARFMGRLHGIGAGQPANLCLIGLNSDGEPEVRRTVVRGTDVYTAPEGAGAGW
jgi:N-acetylglucosamine-6-phosphate deacetylase